MLFDLASPIPLPDRREILQLKRRVRQSCAGGFERFGRADRMGEPPLRDRVIENASQVALGSQAEPKFSNIVPTCAA